MFTVHIKLEGDQGETHAVDLTEQDTVGTVLEKSAEVLRVDKRYLTLLHDGTPLDDLTQGVTGTTLCEGSEVEARVKEPRVWLQSDDVEEEAEAAVSASPDGTLYLDVCWTQGELNLPYRLPHIMRHLILVDTDPDRTHITRIGDGFLINQYKLQSVDLAPLSGVRCIGDGFMSFCQSLEALDMSPLSGFTSFGSNFLNECSSLQELDLRPLSGVVSIGYNFLRGCTSLQSLDLSPLSGVTRIGGSFLASCSSLQTLDLSPLSSVTSIKEKFLWECNSLQGVDLSHVAGAR